jgi:hypothetical protein
MHLKQMDFYQKLIVDISKNNFSDDAEGRELARNMLMNSAVYTDLIGGTATSDLWASKEFDIVKSAGQPEQEGQMAEAGQPEQPRQTDRYEYCQPEQMGIIEASYWLNAEKKGVFESTQSPHSLYFPHSSPVISPETAALYHSINEIGLDKNSLEP